MVLSYYDPGSERAQRVQRLFSKIARHYDLVNDIQSLGFHRGWKRRVINELQLKENARVLDLACGTGDLAFRAMEAQPSVTVVGGDYTFQMLQVAQHRAEKNTYQCDPSHPPLAKGWINLDGLYLPFRDQQFDAVTMGYGLRNMADPKKALVEISRVLRPGGRVAILDFGKPASVFVRLPYFFFLKNVLPFLGWLFFRDAQTYRYIYESLMKYAAQEGVTRLLGEHGFRDVRCFNLALGTMSLHVAVRQ
jgi:demethylmenaquinone methyltransferase / 2-methoxy-6-polyprenyl-1,4-benzoquinol methylase